MVKTVPLPTLVATETFAKHLAPQLRKGDVLALYGTLGMGKTTLARGIIHALGVTGEVPSPTFTLLQTYDAPNFSVTHFDLYRLKSPDELDELGWDDALMDGLTLIEWPERAMGRMPRDYLAVEITASGTSRMCTLTPHGNMRGFS